MKRVLYFSIVLAIVAGLFGFSVFGLESAELQTDTATEEPVVASYRYENIRQGNVNLWGCHQFCNRDCIDLNNETIKLQGGYKVAAYSLDGGVRWKKGLLPTDEAFQRLLNRGMELHLTDKWNTKAIRNTKGEIIDPKGISNEATVIAFERIMPRPKRERVQIFFPYGFHDGNSCISVPEGHYWNDWILLLRGKSHQKPVLDYHFVRALPDGRVPMGRWSNAEQLPMSYCDYIELTDRTVCFFRVPPDRDSLNRPVAASRPFKLTLQPLRPAPNYKSPTVRTGRETVFKLKKGDILYYAYQYDYYDEDGRFILKSFMGNFGPANTTLNIPVRSRDSTLWEWDGSSIGSGSYNFMYRYYGDSSLPERAEIAIPGGAEVYIRRNANGKRPESRVQILKMPSVD
jgi:hypothetical protein